MASTSSIINQYRLDSEFLDGCVAHTTSLVLGQPVTVPATTWVTETKLGTGAFGTVWRQREKGTGQLRAVKVIAKVQLNVREVAALIQLQDYPSFFIQFFGWYEDPHATYLAMEYIEHGDLGQYIDKHGKPEQAVVKEITRQILNALVIMHERSICHRDLKPQNILIKSPSPMWVKITDFGISKRTVETSMRTPCGTTAYQAPEVIGLLPRHMMTSGTNSYSNLVDLWALGAVVHKILTSEIPFQDMYDDSEISLSSLDVGSTRTISVAVDMRLLYPYCQGLENFPTKCLDQSAVTKHGVDFVKSLMAANPKERVSASEALKSKWLCEAESLVTIILLIVSFTLNISSK